MTLQNYLLVMPFLVLMLGGAVFLVSWAMTREAREAPLRHYDDAGWGGRLDLGWGYALISSAIHRYLVQAMNRLR